MIGAMEVARSLHPEFLANTYLAGEPGGEGFVVDAGGPLEPIFEAAERLSITPTHVLLTHHHFDHVEQLPQLLERWPGMDVLMDPVEREALQRAIPDLAALVTGDLRAGQAITVAGIEVRPLATPGHTAGMLSLLADGQVFTGDTLFKHSVGGVRAPGHTTFEDLRRSVMDVLLTLPPQTVIRPGHTDPTTVAHEWDANPFVRVWRGLDPEGDEPCTAFGDPATLVLWADDYDGGHKAWVRWPDGRDDLVPGSQVERG
jgi:glyoxylase-like metal-dependent hydrolase (beta-lactamase superfamily II)